MRNAAAILLISFAVCAPVHQPEQVVGCYTFQHPAKTDTVFLDSVPPTSGAAADDGIAWHRGRLFAYVSDTLTAEQREHDIEVSLRWQRLADSVHLVWSNGQEAVTMTGRWHPDRFVVQALHRWVSDSPTAPVDSIVSSFVRIQCPAGWLGAV